MGKNKKPQSALEQVDSRRRVFLGKLLAGGAAAAAAAAAAIPTISSFSLGSKGVSGRGKGKRGQGKGAKGKGRSGTRGGQPSPDQLAARMLKMHDKDGDGALNSKELTEALKEMFKRRQNNQEK